jgi:N-acetylneuraminate synthase
VEVHIAFSRECFGPDVPASVTTTELAHLVEGVRFIETALAHPVRKDDMAAQLSDLRTMFGKSLVAARDLAPGDALTEQDLAARKPGTGIPVARMDEFVNRRLRRPVAANQRFSEDDFE